MKTFKIYIPKVVYPDNAEFAVSLTPALNLTTAFAICREDGGKRNHYFVAEYESVSGSNRMEHVQDHDFTT